jgi:hypothetical protein
VQLPTLVPRGSNFVHTNAHWRVTDSRVPFGSEDVLRVVQPTRPRTGLSWARPTDSDGEGDVREVERHKICTASLNAGPLILAGFVQVAIRSAPRGLGSGCFDYLAQTKRCDGRAEAAGGRLKQDCVITRMDVSIFRS